MDMVLTLVLIVFSRLVTGEYQYARAGPNDRTPLDEYVAREDNTYSYFELVDERIEDILSTLHFVNMTSQTWMSEDFTTQSVWWHYMAIAVPNFLEVTDTAVIFVGGGNNDNYNPPTPEEDFLSLVIQLYAEQTGSVAVYLKHIPNQPMYFEDDVDYERRTEDSMIAYTWRRFIDDPGFNTDGIARMPMTKAVIRTMDTVTDFISQEYERNIEKFVLAGASKNLHKHYRSLGGWSFALNSYYRENLTRELDNPRTQALMDIVDPYAYMSRYTMPTMVVAATGDQFFLPDDTWYFYDQLPGQKFMLMSANSDHSLAPWLDVYQSFVSFYLGVVNNFQFPEPTWEREFTETGGRIVFRSNVAPRSVVAYVSDTPDPSRRDFRANIGENVEETDVFWEEEVVADLGDSVFVAEYENPEQGWRGFLIEAVYDGPSGEELILTSEVQIIPDTYPFEECFGDGCYGNIV